jgi:hypothetical protein
MVISLFLIGLGYSVNENAYSIIGFFFIFLLAITIIYPGNLEYKTGETMLYEYGDNFTDYHWDQYQIGDEPQFNPSDKSAFLFYTLKEDVYTSFDSSSAHWFGIWLAVISGCGIGISVVEIKKTRQEEE